MNFSEAKEIWETNRSHTECEIIDGFLTGNVFVGMTNDDANAIDDYFAENNSLLESSYLNKLKHCKDCPNFSLMNRIIDGVTITHSLPCCNYDNSVSYKWIGEINYCNRFEERI